MRELRLRIRLIFCSSIWVYHLPSWFVFSPAVVLFRASLLEGNRFVLAEEELLLDIDTDVLL